MIYLGIFKRKEDKHGFDKKVPPVNEWPDYVVTLEKRNFDDFIQKYPLSMVDFWAPWCAPCRVIAPRIRRLSKLNTQNNEDIAKQYHIMGIPHLAFFRYGKEVTSITGVRSIGDLKDKIDALLKN